MTISPVIDAVRTAKVTGSLPGAESSALQAILRTALAGNRQRFASGRVQLNQETVRGSEVAGLHMKHIQPRID